jgi:homoserine dehydrogenase
MTSVVESLAVEIEPACSPKAIRIGQLGLGNVGSALARLTSGSAGELDAYGLAPVTPIALVRSLGRPRPAAEWVGHITDDPDVFFAHHVDVIVEVIGGVEPAHVLVRRALDRGIPVVTANKSLVAAHGDTLSDLAGRRGVAFRYEASCIAGVPFLGTFERRPLASRVNGLTAILNGTSNTILTAVARGATFADALEDAQRRGLAEPDPSADVLGRDAAEKLTLLIRRFAQLLIATGDLSTTGITALDPRDLRAAAALGGTLKPVAHASWSTGALQAFVGPAFLLDRHPLASVSGATNGILLDAPRGRQCYIGPGAGPDVTAVTLLDDVCEVAREGNGGTTFTAAARPAVPRWTTESAWFVRFGECVAADTVELLGTYGVWCAHVAAIDRRGYALTFPATSSRIGTALDAVCAATGANPLAIPALPAEELAC